MIGIYDALIAGAYRLSEGVDRAACWLSRRRNRLAQRLWEARADIDDTEPF